MMALLSLLNMFCVVVLVLRTLEYRVFDFRASQKFCFFFFNLGTENNSNFVISTCVLAFVIIKVYSSSSRI